LKLLRILERLIATCIFFKRNWSRLNLEEEKLGQ